MKTINTFLICILLSCSVNITAQNYIDIVKVSSANSTANRFDSTSAKTSLQEYNGDLTVPIVINKNLAILSGVTYEMIQSSLNPGRPKESFSGITLKAGVNIQHNSNWSGIYMLLPKISSDLQKISNKDFQLGGLALLKYEKSKQMNYKLGVYANNELFGPFIVPILGFYYTNKSEKFEVKVLLPLSVDINYKILKNTRMGLQFQGQVRSYNMNSTIGNNRDVYVVKSTNDLYANVQYEIKNGFNIQLGVGRSLGRSYRMYNEKVSFGMPLSYFGDNRTQLNTDFSDGWLIKLTAFYRLKLK